MDHAADILIIFVIKEAFKFIISLSIEYVHFFQETVKILNQIYNLWESFLITFAPGLIGEHFLT